MLVATSPSSLVGQHPAEMSQLHDSLFNASLSNALVRVQGSTSSSPSTDIELSSTTTTTTQVPAQPKSRLSRGMEMIEEEESDDDMVTLTRVFSNFWCRKAVVESDDTSPQVTSFKVHETSLAALLGEPTFRKEELLRTYAHRVMYRYIHAVTQLCLNHRVGPADPSSIVITAHSMTPSYSCSSYSSHLYLYVIARAGQESLSQETVLPESVVLGALSVGMHATASLCSFLAAHAKEYSAVSLTGAVNEDLAPWLGYLVRCIDSIICRGITQVDDESFPAPKMTWQSQQALDTLMRGKSPSITFRPNQRFLSSISSASL